MTGRTGLTSSGTENERVMAAVRVSKNKNFIFAVLLLVSLILTTNVIADHDQSTIPTTFEEPFKPVTVPLDKSFRGNAVDLPDTDPRVKRRISGFQPEQISVSLSSTYDSVWISWITDLSLSLSNPLLVFLIILFAFAFVFVNLYLGMASVSGRSGTWPDSLTWAGNPGVPNRSRV
ncbi:hypothetical protein QYF36_018766 [Acer negundo]|nr:hypothetical protein QYF36_018766 [Acer negundo]